MTHEPECAWAGQPNDDNCPTCNLITIGYKRGREDAAKAVEALEGITVTGDHRSIYGAVLKLVASDAARGAEPHQADTDQHPDSQRFRYGNGNNIPTVGNTILDDSDDEKVVADNYVDNVTDAGDTPQPATTWVRSLLQPGDVDTPDTRLNEPINDAVRTVSPASTLQNRQAADADV